MTAIKTRKNEQRIRTIDPREMIGNYLTTKLLRKWSEDFIDEASGEAVTIERNEVIAYEGTLITNDLLTEINFFLQEGSLKYVEVSDQQRTGTLYKGVELTPWTITATIKGKNKKFLLYADSPEMAIEVAVDFIELNFQGLFALTAVKSFGNCIVLRQDAEELTDEEQEQTEEIDKKFYKVEVAATWGEARGGNYIFIAHAADVDSSLLLINRYISEMATSEEVKNLGYNPDCEIEYAIKLLAASPISVSVIIPKDFSLAYTSPNEKV